MHLLSGTLYHEASLDHLILLALHETTWLPRSYELSNTSRPGTFAHSSSSSPFRYMWQYRWKTTRFFLLSNSAPLYFSAIIWATPLILPLFKIFSVSMSSELPFSSALSWWELVSRYLGWALNGTRTSVPWNFRLLSSSCSKAQAWTLISPPTLTMRRSSARQRIRLPSVLKWCMTAMQIAASQLSSRNGTWIQSATTTAGLKLNARFFLDNSWYCGPSKVSSTFDAAAVRNRGSLGKS